MTVRQRRIAAVALAVWTAIVLAGALSNRGFSAGPVRNPDALPAQRPPQETAAFPGEAKR